MIMKELYTVLLIIPVIAILSMIITFFSGDKKFFSLWKSYKYPLEVQCIKMDNKCITRNKNFGNYYEGIVSGLSNVRVHYDIKRPYFQGKINGKNYTFVRTQDTKQPVCEIGKNYTIYIRNLEDINCKDFYEEKEIKEMKEKIKKKKELYTVGVILSVMMIVILTLLIF